MDDAIPHEKPFGIPLVPRLLTLLAFDESFRFLPTKIVYHRYTTLLRRKEDLTEKRGFCKIRDWS
jgi:hypothetical protein